tara:strand:- start:6519 stop:6941 length:423 start_codon:yes stop_codon:yes gene_type:complete
MAQGFGPIAPMRIDPVDGIALSKNYRQLVTEQLKMLLLCSPGERIMDANFGVGARRYLFEQDHPSTYATLKAKIYEQVNKYLTYIDLKEVQFLSQGTGHPNMPDNLVNIRIVYKIKPLNMDDIIEVSVMGEFAPAYSAGI